MVGPHYALRFAAGDGARQIDASHAKDSISDKGDRSMKNCLVTIFGPNQHNQADAFYNQAASNPTKQGAAISSAIGLAVVRRQDKPAEPQWLAPNVADGSFIVLTWDK